MASNLQRQFNWKNFTQSKIAFFVAIVILILLGRGAIITFLKAREVGLIAESTQSKLESLKNRQTELSEKINFLSTEEGKEMELRSIYNAALPGESVVLIVDNKNTTSTPKIQKTWWQKFLNFFN